MECNQCKHCKEEGCLGHYITLVCDIYGYLEAFNNPHHDLDADKCDKFEERK